MKILYIGAGFVGATSAAASAASGHDVLVYDIDENKINKLASNDRDQIESCLFEDGLGDLIVRNAERLKFTTNFNSVKDYLDQCDAVFLCLPTPEIDETGETNLSYYFAAAEKLAEGLKNRNASTQEKYVVIVNKSTVPIELVDKTKEIMEKNGVINFGLVSNPEFLVEGKAVQGSIKPDRIVIGAWNQVDFEIMRRIYQRFYDASAVEYIEVNPKEAAAGKLLANFYLFNKLAICFDVIGRTCEAISGLHFENMRKILTSDLRIGTWGFYDSLYAGGSCFIKDARSLAHQLQTKGVDTDIIYKTHSANEKQLELFISRAEKEVGFDWQNKNVAILGTAFKRDTNDVRNSPSIKLTSFLIEKKVKTIKVYDPVALNNFEKVFPDAKEVEYMKNESEAVENVDVVIIATDWPQFRGLADIFIRDLKNKPLIMDGRRMLQHRYDDLVQAGFKIIAVGSPLISN